MRGERTGDIANSYVLFPLPYSLLPLPYALFHNNILLSAEFAEFVKKRFVQDTSGADALFFFFTVQNHTPLAREHGKQKLDMLKERILLGGELDPEDFFRVKG